MYLVTTSLISRGDLAELDFLTGADAAFADLIAVERLRVAIGSS